MKTMYRKEIKVRGGLTPFLHAFGKMAGFYMLDSEGEGGRGTGRYSFIGIDPVFSVVQKAGGAYLEKKGKTHKLGNTALEYIREHLAANSSGEGPFPFNSGFIGHLTYDYGLALIDKIRRTKTVSRPAVPFARFNYYDSIFVWDNRLKKTCFVSRRKDADERPYLKRLKTVKTAKTALPAMRFPALRSSLSRKKYLDIITRTREYIAAGDIYQANISQRFSCRFHGSPIRFYDYLRRISPAPFGAYLREKDYTILCNSPERFLYKKGGYIETRPIKGTRKRSRSSGTDRKLRDELRKSAKDKAEHIMIVDLERNDLGRVCTIGSVHVKNMMDIESYANVHHMVSTVAGTLRPGQTIIDCLGSCFPGGSITGAPKIRSMEIIDELEPVNRGIYCGAIGYIDDSGNADLNIAIRTGVVSNNTLSFCVGGGIVSDSVPEDEFEETIIKARSFLAAMGRSEVTDR